MAETRELMVDGELMTFTRQPDRNGEYLYVADNGRFVKFEKTVNIEEAIARHNEVNGRPVEKVEDVTYGRVEHRTATTQPTDDKK